VGTAVSGSALGLGLSTFGQHSELPDFTIGTITAPEDEDDEDLLAGIRAIKNTAWWGLMIPRSADRLLHIILDDDLILTPSSSLPTEDDQTR